MLALARKYRPRDFASVAVQSHVSNTLKGAIARGRVAHGYLLCGPRGVGKTTLARVLAMALNCENKQPDGEPCGVCSSCTRIWSGGASLDVVEIDAASNRGVDDARELRERAMYAPSGEDRYKVYIVDEAHMLTREAWNALLKILEEPPPRVVFVFATTEPQKIAQAAAPVLSRLQRFDLKRIGPADIRERLAHVLGSEQVPAEPEALAMIARAADGSMRDALSLTDQVLALGEGTVTAGRVREALGLVAEDEYIAVLDLIAERRAGDVFPAVARLVELGVDLGQFLAGLADIVRAQLALSLGAAQIEVSAAARDALESRRDRLPPGDLLRMLHAVSELEPRFRRSTQQQLLLETLLVRFALLDRTVDLESVLREMGGGGGSGGAVRPTSPSRPVAPVAPASPAGAPDRGRDGGHRSDPSRRTETPVETQRVQDSARAPDSTRPHDRATRPSSLSDSSPLALAASALATKPAPAPRLPGPVSGPVSLELNALVGEWDEIVAAVRRERPIVGTLLEHALPSGVSTSGVVTLQVEDSGSFEGLAAKSRDLAAALAVHVQGLSRVQLLPPDSPPRWGSPQRMTAESVKSDTLLAIRKRDPLLAAAIDELDLDLIG